MRAIANAKQSYAIPSAQTIDLHGQQFDFRPIIELSDAIPQERGERHDVAVQRAQSALFDRFDAALWNYKASLIVSVSINQDEQFAVTKESE